MSELPIVEGSIWGNRPPRKDNAKKNMPELRTGNKDKSAGSDNAERKPKEIQ